MELTSIVSPLPYLLFHLLSNLYWPQAIHIGRCKNEDLIPEYLLWSILMTNRRLFLCIYRLSHHPPKKIERIHLNLCFPSQMTHLLDYMKLHTSKPLVLCKYHILRLWSTLALLKHRIIICMVW